MPLTRTCPRCGKTPDDEPFVGSFCRSCYLGHHELYSEPDVTLYTCTQCGRYRLRGYWQKPTHLEAYLREKTKTPHQITAFSADFSQEKHAVMAHVRMTVNAHGTDLDLDRTFRLPLEKMTCPDCTRQSGGYHEAILQIRGDDPKQIEAKAESMMKKIQRKTFIAKVEPQKNGIDIWVGDQRALFELLAGTKYTAAKKLAGERAGKRLYRSSLCIRV